MSALADTGFFYLFVAEVSYGREVTDEDVADLIAAGYSEDAIFEATVSAAVGAGMKRWSTAKAAMETGAD